MSFRFFFLFRFPPFSFPSLRVAAALAAASTVFALAAPPDGLALRRNSPTVIPPLLPAPRTTSSSRGGRVVIMLAVVFRTMRNVGGRVRSNASSVRTKGDENGPHTRPECFQKKKYLKNPCFCHMLATKRPIENKVRVRFALPTQLPAHNSVATVAELNGQSYVTAQRDIKKTPSSNLMRLRYICLQSVQSATPNLTPLDRQHQ